MTMPTTGRAAQEIARVLGADVRQNIPRWLNLMREGVIVRLHVRRWRARAKLSFADLGLPVSADDAWTFAELMQLGEKRLLPADTMRELEAIESAGRKCLERHAFTTFWGPLIAVTNYDQWKAENDAHAARYLAARDKLIAAYDETVTSLLDDYTRAARAAYRRMNALTSGQMTRDEYRDEYYFVQTFVSRIKTLIPSADQIEASFAWETELEYIPLPSLLAEETAAAERIQAARDIERAEEELRKESLWRTVSIEQGAAEERRRMLERMNAAVVEEARKKKQELINGFLGDLVKQLRSLVYDACLNVLESMEANEGRLGPRAVVQLKNLVSQVERLNFFDDAEMTAAAAQVKRAIAGDADARNTTQIANVLRDIATVTRSSLIALAADPRPARAIGLADVPAAEIVRAARARLLPDETPPAKITRPERSL